MPGRRKHLEHSDIEIWHPVAGACFSVLYEEVIAHKLAAVWGGDYKFWGGKIPRPPPDIAQFAVCVYVCWSHTWNMQKRLNRSRFRLGCGLVGPKSPCSKREHGSPGKGALLRSFWVCSSMPAVDILTVLRRNSNDAAFRYQ